MQTLSPIGKIDLHTVQNVIFVESKPHFLFFVRIPTLPLRFWKLGSQLPTTVQGGADGGRTDCTINLRASLFSEGLSRIPLSFSQIHLAGQSLLTDNIVTPLVRTCTRI
jgi:hypothetical protein